MKQINIICFGNSLCADDGAGFTVFEQLQSELAKEPLREQSIELFYAGNSGQRALPYFMNASHVIVVDALQSQSAADQGKLYCMSGDDLSALDDLQDKTVLSSHMMMLPQAWQLIKTLKITPPELTVFAIEATDTMAFQQGLSPKVEKIVVDATKRILQLCHEVLR